MLDEAYDIINGLNNPAWQEWCDKVCDIEEERWKHPAKSEK